MEQIMMELTALVAPYKGHLVAFAAGSVIGVYLYNRILKVMITLAGAAALAGIAYVAMAA